MKILPLFSCFILVSILLHCKSNSDKPQEIIQDYPLYFSVYAENETDFTREEELIKIDVRDIQAKYPDFNPLAFVVFDGMKELPSQILDSNGDGLYNQLVFLSNFSSAEKKKLDIYYATAGAKNRSYPRRTQAELAYKFGGEFKKNQKGRYEYSGGKFKNMEYLKVPPQHSDHSFFIRYEGPGWESDKVGYRFYLDWRNAIDIFGKKIPDMVLQDVGQDGFDSYHEMSDWGMDILKVGDALGIGGIGMWYEDGVKRVSKTDSITSEIIASGPVYSQIRTVYYGWQEAEGKYDLVSDLSIWAGSRMTRHDINITGNPSNLCTGIVKYDEVTVLENSKDDLDWGYLATYGKQSLAEDQLGMAVFFREQDVLEITEDQHNHVVVLKPTNGILHYYFLAAWEQEQEGIKSELQFKDYLETMRRELNHPLKITL